MKLYFVVIVDNVTGFSLANRQAFPTRESAQRYADTIDDSYQPLVVETCA